jgi:hypothetical protein
MTGICMQNCEREEGERREEGQRTLSSVNPIQLKLVLAANGTLPSCTTSNVSVSIKLYSSAFPAPPFARCTIIAQSFPAAIATTSSPRFSTYFCSPAPLKKRTKFREVATRTVPEPVRPTEGSSMPMEEGGGPIPPMARTVASSPAGREAVQVWRDVHDSYGL